MLKIERWFTNEGVHPFDEIEWNYRDVELTDEKGKVLFKQLDVEAPTFWSDLAVKVVVSKYFWGELGTPQREKSVKQLLTRVCSKIAKEGQNRKYFSKKGRKIFEEELIYLCLNQCASFNSPVWFNVGLFEAYGAGTGSGPGNYCVDSKTGDIVQAPSQYERPQCSACFIQSVEDNMDSIMNLAVSEARLFKFGSGTGSDLSTIRSAKEKLSGGGTPSGPLSFLKIYDQVANVVKSGGKTRRAAKMNTLYDWHGDIEEFIDAKRIEEGKARALVNAGYEGSLTGPAYSAAAYQNENLTVRVTDEFMEAVKQDKPWETKAVTTGEVLETKSAKALFHKIALGTWDCGDPGIQFDSQIQKWFTCSGSGDVKSSNPCSEFLFLNDSSCNLASLNLMKFRGYGGMSFPDFTEAVRLITIAQDIIVDLASYPTAKIAKNTHDFRALGLGYTNLGAFLMSIGIPYASDEGRFIASTITSLMTAYAYRTSAEMAESLGSFNRYFENKDKMLEVIKLHSDAYDKKIDAYPSLEDHLFEPTILFASDVWNRVYEMGQKSGFRNAQVTVLAPTGTISFMMDCDTTGVEPDIALVKYKKLVGGGLLKIVNSTTQKALQELKYSEEEVEKILKHIEEHDTIEDVCGDGKPVASGLKPEHLPIFDCAFKPSKGSRFIHADDHLRMMAAIQPFISGAISKTVNMPSNATVEDIEQAYMKAWEWGLKCVAIYRDGSKFVQPLNVSKDSAPVTGEQKEVVESLKKQVAEMQSKFLKEKGEPYRHRLPVTRNAINHKFGIADHEGYLTVGLYDDGTPGELFITMSKEGSTIGGLMDCIATLTSMALQYGVPLASLVRKFEHQRFEPWGFTKNPEIRNVSSIVDYIFRWMGLRFLKPSELKEEVKPVVTSLSESVAHFQKDAPICPVCGCITVRNGACYKCVNCGESLGCS